ncbi:MAG: hypothetical protein EOO53_14065 [Gammaproteobacteria bacterium]|nr:MAG: hypothetical protein EOO53_14065 [Gammaproteobacteria bacterium]
MLIPYALNGDGDFVYVDEVKRGLACNCVCSECGGALVKRVSDENLKIDHFAHFSNTCKAISETVLHKLIKSILLSTDTLAIPDSNGEPVLITIQSARCEVTLHNYRVDVLLNEGLSDELIVEVVVHHRVSIEKQVQLSKLGFRGIIINAPLHIIQLSPNEIRTFIVESLYSKMNFLKEFPHSSHDHSSSRASDESRYSKPNHSRSRIRFREELIPSWSKYYKNIGLNRVVFKRLKTQFASTNKENQLTQLIADNFVRALIEEERIQKYSKKELPKFKGNITPAPVNDSNSYLKASRGE